jgi:hypothetical protein
MPLVIRSSFLVKTIHSPGTVYHSFVSAGPNTKISRFGNPVGPKAQFAKVRASAIPAAVKCHLYRVRFTIEDGGGPLNEVRGSS